jgi:hypothetical protein
MVPWRHPVSSENPRTGKTFLVAWRVESADETPKEAKVILLEAATLQLEGAFEAGLPLLAPCAG